MCKASNSPQGKTRCDVSSHSRQRANARKRARYLERKETADVGAVSNSGGTSGVPQPSGLEEGIATGAGTSGRNLDGRQDSHGSRAQPRLTVGDRSVNVVGVHDVPMERKQQLRAMGKSVPQLVELDPEENAGYFHEKITALANKETNPYHASVYVYDTEEYKNMRLFMTKDATAGIALKEDGDIVSVFSVKGSQHKGVANSMIATAVSLGGKKLDCFDTVLPSIYAQEGFVETGRMQWDDQYKPDGWEYETYTSFNDGRPDVVFMEYRENE